VSAYLETQKEEFKRISAKRNERTSFMKFICRILLVVSLTFGVFGASPETSAHKICLATIKRC